MVDDDVPGKTRIARIPLGKAQHSAALISGLSRGKEGGRGGRTSLSFLQGTTDSSICIPGDFDRGKEMRRRAWTSLDQGVT